MTTLLEYVVAGLEKDPESVYETLSEWSLCCMTALRSKDVDCKTSIHLITKHTIEKLLLNLNLETTRPWTSVREIEESFRQRIESPMQLVIDDLIKQISDIRNPQIAEKRSLKQLIEKLKNENFRLQTENAELKKSWFRK